VHGAEGSGHRPIYLHHCGNLGISTTKIQSTNLTTDNKLKADSMKDLEAKQLKAKNNRITI
jgi:hypothetical protein